MRRALLWPLALLLASCNPNTMRPTRPAIAAQPLPHRLRAHIEHLATTIGERNLHVPANLARAKTYLESAMKDAGYETVALPFQVGSDTVYNLEATLPGAAQANEVVVIGAHYDSALDCPAANDNGSGVAAVIEIARALRHTKPARTVRFVLFVNEEPPYFQGPNMGSVVYAKLCKQRGDNVVAMLSLETIGYYSDAPGSQRYPQVPGINLPTGPGNFIAFVANLPSAPLLQEAADAFKAATPFPIESRALPELIPGIGFSDHWSFWREDFPALMVTDTAMFRYPHYHEPTDTPDKLDYPRMTQVVESLIAVTAKLARQ